MAITESTRTALDELSFLFAIYDDSSLAKVADLFGAAVQAILNDFEKMMEWKMIDNVSGQALDVIGAQYGQDRRGQDDDFFKYLIKTRLLMKTKKGTINDIISVITTLSGIDASTLIVENDPAEIAAIRISNVPSFLAETPEKKALIQELFQSLLPAGIRLTNISYVASSEGTITMLSNNSSFTRSATPVATMPTATN